MRSSCNRPAAAAAPVAARRSRAGAPPLRILAPPSAATALAAKLSVRLGALHWQPIGGAKRLRGRCCFNSFCSGRARHAFANPASAQRLPASASCGVLSEKGSSSARLSMLHRPGAADSHFNFAARARSYLLCVSPGGREYFGFSPKRAFCCHSQYR